ncbi:MAG: DMT family transporter [Porphyromonas sp.]|nr:DMT family transporter [Porphyromonas sp.]
MKFASRTGGWLIGIISSATFGLIPLFAKPILQSGVPHETVVFFRFVLATLMLGIIHLCSGGSFRLKRKEFFPLLILGGLYTASAMLLFWGYSQMSSGIATVIHYMYPFFVSFILFAVFRERIGSVTLLATCIAVLGVSLLMGLWQSSEEISIGFWAFFVVLVSGLSYAIYIVVVHHSAVRNMSGKLLSFWVLLTASAASLGNAIIRHGEINLLPDLSSWINILLLALIPTVISNIALVVAVQSIGATRTAVLGAMEPLTAVLVGITFFHEEIATSGHWGIVFILIAVLLTVLSGELEQKLRGYYRHFRRAITRRSIERHR